MWKKTKEEKLKSKPKSGAKKAACDTKYESWLSAIWRNTALGRAEFDLTYGALFNQALDYLDVKPSNGWPSAEYQDIRNQTLDLVNTALRVRQAHIIPKGLPSEDVSRLSELMSFVIAVSVVLEQVNKYIGDFKFDNEGQPWCPLIEKMPQDAEIIGLQNTDSTFALLLFPRLVTEHGIRWINQEPEALNQMLLYFKDQERSEIYTIIATAKAKASILQIPNRKNSAQGKAGRSPVKPQEATEGDNTPNGISDKNEGQGGVTGARETCSEEELLDEAPQTAAKGYLYLSWLRGKLDNKEISVNESESPIHILNDGTVFLRVPEAFEAYAQEKDVTAKRVQNQLVRLDQHKIKKDGKDIYLGKDDNGKRVVGLVLKSSGTLWPNSQPGYSKIVMEAR